MIKISTASLIAPVSTQQAREELGKLFELLELTDTMPEMFSAYIDAEWHRLMATADYSDFCRQTAGADVVHLPNGGEGLITWIDLYHERHGALPAVWFADANGIVDSAAYCSYLDTQTVRASWNCGPDGGDPDFTTACPTGDTTI